MWQVDSCDILATVNCLHLLNWELVCEKLIADLVHKWPAFHDFFEDFQLVDAIITLTVVYIHNVNVCFVVNLKN